MKVAYRARKTSTLNSSMQSFVLHATNMQTVFYKECRKLKKTRSGKKSRIGVRDSNMHGSRTTCLTNQDAKGHFDK